MDNMVPIFFVITKQFEKAQKRAKYDKVLSPKTNYVFLMLRLLKMSLKCGTYDILFYQAVIVKSQFKPVNCNNVQKLYKINYVHCNQKNKPIRKY